MKSFSFNKLFAVQVILVMLLFSHQNSSKVPENLAYVLLNKTLWRDDQDAVKRQSIFRKVVTLMILGGVTVDGQTTVSNVEECAMVPAALQAEYYRRRKNFPLMLFWLNYAMEADPYPRIQKAIVLPPYGQLRANGDFVIGWSDQQWQFRKDFESLAYVTHSSQGTIEIFYRNRLSVRDNVVYYWSGPVELSYWNSISLTAKISTGSFFTVESHTSQISRHLQYYQGDDKWSDFVLPLGKETKLRNIYLSLSEPSADAEILDYKVELAPITLQLDRSVGSCNYK